MTSYVSVSESSQEVISDAAATYDHCGQKPEVAVYVQYLVHEAPAFGVDNKNTDTDENAAHAISTMS